MKLKELIVIRPILIVVLVAYHCFLPFSTHIGIPSWIEFPDTQLYRLLDKALYSCMLEIFTFMSGCIFGYQVLYGKYAKRGGGVNAYISIIYSKIRRLIFPCIIFGILYLLLFSNSKSIAEFIINVVLGPGHLWYLNSLFLIFIVSYPILKLKINEILKLGLLFTVGSFSALVFYQPRISFTLYLLFFFYLGICVSFYRDKIGKYIYSSKLTVYLAGICWIILFAFKSFKFSQYADGFSEIYTAQFLLVKTCTAIAGLMTLYAAAYRWTLRHNLGNKLTYFGEYCFGIYIVHQFIIYALYRYSIFPLRCNQYLLPWLTTIIVILSSYLISIALKKTILKKII